MTRKLSCLQLLIASVLLSMTASQSPAFSARARVVSPRECFQSFNNAVRDAKDLSTVEQYFSRPLRIAYKKYTDTQRQAKLKELKEYYIRRYVIKEENITGSKESATATLAAKGVVVSADKRKNKKRFLQTDRLTYVKEGHYWRISTAAFERSRS